MPGERELTDLQLIVLDTLWRTPDLTVAEVHATVSQRTRASRAVVNTLLWRLERRGLVTRRVRGEQMLYRAKAKRQRVLVDRLAALLAALFDSPVEGAPASLAAGDVSPGDTARLRELLRMAEADLAPAKRRRKGVE